MISSAHNIYNKFSKLLQLHTITQVISNKVIIIRLQRPESGCVVWVLACVRVCVVRPFPGGQHSHAAGARDETGARPAQAMRLTANTKRKP